MNIFERFKNKKHSKNYPNWENTDYISFLEKSNKITNKEERKKLLEKAEIKLINEMPLTPIYHHNYITLTNKKLKNVFIGPLGELHFDKAYFK